MSQYEQDACVGRAFREKEEAQRELRCWRDKALRMGRTMTAVDTALKNLGHEEVPLDTSDALVRSIEAHPTKEEVKTIFREVQRLSAEIARLEKVISG